MILLRVVVVLGDLRAELDLTHRDLLLVLPSRLLLLRLLVLVFGVVEDPTHGRTRVRGDLDQVEISLLRVRERFGGLDNSDLLAILADEPNLGHAYALVGPRLVPLRRAPVEPSWDRH